MATFQADPGAQVAAIEAVRDAWNAQRDPSWLVTDTEIDEALARAHAAVRATEELPGLVGAETSAHGPDPTVSYSLRYQVVELADLVVSNRADGSINPDYPQAFQPRDRTRAVSQMQVEGIAAGLNPDVLLTPTLRIDDGPPIIGRDLVVESGNARSMALRRATETNVEAFEAYHQALLRRAPEYGIDPQALAGMRQPVLVRVHVGEVDRPEFVRLANTSATMGMSFTESALSDARRFTPDTLAATLSLQGGDPETVHLTETGNATGVFTGPGLSVVHGAAVAADGSLENDHYSTFTVNARYADPQDSGPCVIA